MSIIFSIVIVVKVVVVVADVVEAKLKAIVEMDLSSVKTKVKSSYIIPIKYCTLALNHKGWFLLQLLVSSCCGAAHSVDAVTMEVHSVVVTVTAVIVVVIQTVLESVVARFVAVVVPSLL